MKINNKLKKNPTFHFQTMEKMYKKKICDRRGFFVSDVRPTFKIRSPMGNIGH
jgi:hypothetical protein